MGVKRTTLLIGGVPLIVVSAIFSLILYSMSEMDIEHLVMCSLNEGGTRIPSSLCEYYMVNYRITDNDLDVLEKGPGLDFILNGNNPHKYDIAKIFISKGLSVNSVNHLLSSDISPLYSAVLFNDVKKAEFLVNNGADIHFVSKDYGMTVLELAKNLHENSREGDRSEIVQILSGSGNTGNKNN